MRLALGTASWGRPYGITRQHTPWREALRILDVARREGLTLIDTAPAYGCDDFLWDCAADFDVVSKTPWDGRSWYGVIIHQATLEDLPELLEIRQCGLLERCGVSVYTPEQLEKALEYPIDLVQFPLNILDGRFLPYLRQLRRAGVEIHVRSVFLQGLLLMDNPPFAREEVEEIRKRGDPLEVCLGYVMTQDVDAIVVGVNRARELEKLLQVQPYETEGIMTDPWIIDPRVWGEKR